MTEASILAVAAAIQAVCHLVEKVMDGQPADVRAKLWEWYAKDAEAWRTFFGLPR